MINLTYYKSKKNIPVRNGLLNTAHHEAWKLPKTKNKFPIDFLNYGVIDIDEDYENVLSFVDLKKNTEKRDELRTYLQKSTSQELLVFSFFEAVAPITKISWELLEYDYMMVGNIDYTNSSEVIDIMKKHKIPLKLNPTDKEFKNHMFLLEFGVIAETEAHTDGLCSKGAFDFIILQIEKGTRKVRRTYVGSNGHNAYIENQQKFFSFTMPFVGSNFDKRMGLHQKVIYFDHETQTFGMSRIVLSKALTPLESKPPILDFITLWDSGTDDLRKAEETRKGQIRRLAGRIRSGYHAVSRLTDYADYETQSPSRSAGFDTSSSSSRYHYNKVRCDQRELVEISLKRS